MKRHARLTVALAIAIAIGIALIAAASAAAESNLRVIASGLNNPRGLTFGPNGTLYVAFGGTGGTMTTTAQQCRQVAPPIGPYHGGFTSGIAKVGLNGTVTPFVTGLPSSSTAALGGLTSGVADVKFVDGTLYAMTAGAGCSHGLFGTSNEILRVNPNGTTAPVANLSAWSLNHPTAVTEADFEPDGTWYSMAPFQGHLFAVEPNHGEVVEIDPQTGAISRVVDVSASQGHIVPTAIAHWSLFDNLFGGGIFRNLIGQFTVGNLGEFPIDPGSSQLMQVGVNGSLAVRQTGFTTVLGLVYDSSGNLYVLESMTAPGFPGPAELGTGRILRVSLGRTVVVATGLSFPSAMTMGPDGALYVSNFGFASPPGAGQIVRVDLGRASLP
jgi:hypothetical protein